MTGTCGALTCGNGVCGAGETCSSCPTDCGLCPGVCPGPFSGSGSNGGSGTTCLGTYSFNAIAGNTYTISTCGGSTGDTYLVVSGACSCTDDDYCASFGGSQCTCTATSSGPVTICASTYSSSSGSWNYTIAGTCGP